MRRLPILSTLIVAAAVAVLIGLGIWQLQRAEWKERLIAEIEASKNAPPVNLLDALLGEPGLHLRRTTIDCDIQEDKPLDIGPGQRADGRAGYFVYTTCTDRSGVVPFHAPELLVVAGWTANPAVEKLTFHGQLHGVLRERKAGPPRYDLIPDEPIPPLEKPMQPTAASLPNNHMFYAVQWFFFAFAAALIYVLALRRRQRP